MFLHIESNIQMACHFDNKLTQEPEKGSDHIIYVVQQGEEKIESFLTYTRLSQEDMVPNFSV